MSMCNADLKSLRVILHDPVAFMNASLYCYRVDAVTLIVGVGDLGIVFFYFFFFFKGPGPPRYFPFSPTPRSPVPRPGGPRGWGAFRSRAFPGSFYRGALRGGGVVDQPTHPPLVGAAYPVLIPPVDTDGHDRAG